VLTEPSTGRLELLRPTGPRRRGELRAEVEAALGAAVQARRGALLVNADVPVAVVAGLEDLRPRVRSAVEAGEFPVGAGLDLLRRLDAARHELAEDAVDRRLRILSGMRGCTERLREIPTTAALACEAPREIAALAGFSRVMFSRVTRSRWIPETIEITASAGPDDDLRSYLAGVEIPLSHTLLEADLVRRRVPACVADPRTESRVFRELVRRARCTSYVAAPIIAGGRVVGLLHADRVGQGFPVGVGDRDILWAFAEQLGLVHERAGLSERLQRHRDRVRRALADLVDEVTATCALDVDLVARVAPERPAGPAADPQGRLDALLTAREREVLQLMASGATNSAIAAEFVLAESTIKSHAKSINRKLRVSSRAAAVAKYLQLTLGDA